jgi:small GTP-binding protein
MPPKLVLVGDTSVGKTAIISRVRSGRHIGGFQPTIGVASGELKVDGGDGESVAFSFWDTAGQEKYRTLVPMHIRGAHAAIVVYDLTQRPTYDSLANWCEQLHQSAPACEIAVVGNKSDLVTAHSDRCVSYKEAESHSRALGAGLYIETSAATGENIPELFRFFADSPAIREAISDLDGGISLGAHGPANGNQGTAPKSPANAGGRGKCPC